MQRVHVATRSDSEDIVERTIGLLENVRHVQRSVLERLLDKNSSCQYLQRYCTDGNITVGSYKDLVPLVKYLDVEPDIRRIAHGESNILTCDEITHFHESSGTSDGKFKQIPVSATAREANALFSRTKDAWIQQTPIFQHTLLAFPDGVDMTFLFYGHHLTTPGGHELSLASSFYARSPDSCYRMRPTMFASPIEVILCRDYRQSLYCQLLCGLLQSSRVVSMASVIITVLAIAVEFLKENWEELCKDIETGVLNERITNGEVRQALTKILVSSNPDLANRIRDECQKKSWAGIILRLWPNLKYISAICTGALLHYVEHLEFLTDSNVKIMSMLYGCSEGAIAFNPLPETHPKEVAYVFHPEMGYFEFRRLKDSAVIDLADMKEGDDDFEVIFTTLSGLWRYRMGDIVKCVGYYHSSPTFKFVGRDSLLVSVSNEMICEYEMTQAVESAATLYLPPGKRLVNYTTTVNLKQIPGHYVVFWEVENTGSILEDINVDDNRTKEGMEQCCLAIENALTAKYRRDRLVGIIGPLELILVKEGTFSLLDTQAQVAHFSDQKKQPRIYRPDHLALSLLFSAAQQHFSTLKPLRSSFDQYHLDS